MHAPMDKHSQTSTTTMNHKSSWIRVVLLKVIILRDSFVNVGAADAVDSVCSRDKEIQEHSRQTLAAKCSIPDAEELI